MTLIRRLPIVAAVLLLTAAPLLGFTGYPSHAFPSLSAPAPTHHAPGGAPDALWLLPAIGAIRVKDTASLAKKFVTRASGAAGDYKSGVEASGQDWEANARAGADNYAAGVTQAIGDKRFERGIANAGAAKFTSRAGTLGAQRFPSGVQASEGDWSKGVNPYLDAIKSMDLPPRRPKGDPGNQARANAVAARLRQVKLGK
jgi:hypothetical protein